MAAVSGIGERRRTRRISPDASPWKAEALLRPGVTVRVVNIGPDGALIESPARLRPGHRAELQLSAHDSDMRHLAIGRIHRCQIMALNPLRFRGAIVFETSLPCDVIG